MTIASIKNTPRNTYTATAGQTVFNIGFEFFNVNDIKVYKNGTLLTYNASPSTSSQYKVTGTASSSDDAYEFGSGGTITLGAGATLNDSIVIIRDIAIERLSDFPTSGSFDITSLNTQLDTLVSMMSEQDTLNSRSVRLADTDVDSATITLPNVTTRASKVMAFDASGNIVTNISSLGLSTLATITADITTVAGISADVSQVASDSADVQTVATNIASINTVSTNIADVITVANDLNEAISEVETVANDLNEAVSEIDTVGNNITYVQTVGDSTNIANITTVAGQISPTNNISTVAGIAPDITTLAGTAGLTTLANNAADISIVAGISGDVTAVANIDSAVSAVNSNAPNINAVNSNSTNINSVASNLAGSNTIGTVATDLTGANTIGTVATNIAQVQNFANVYRISSTAPTISNDLGDLYFDTTANELKVYKSSGWAAAGSTVNGTANRFEYTATASQTTFTGADSNGAVLAYDSGFIDVYLNGVKLAGADYTATNGTSIVLTSGAALNDILMIVAYGTFQLANISINDLIDTPAALGSAGQALVVNSGGTALEYANSSSAEVYGFNKNASGQLIVTTTGGGVDNIDAATYAGFDDVIFASTGFTFSISSGKLIATI